MQVVSLQSKWIGDVLAKAFGAKLFETSLDGLRQFLPVGMTISDAVLCRPLVPVLTLLHAMLHNIDLEAHLATVGTVIDGASLATFCRPIVRLGTMTGFKRLKQSCHSVVTAVSMDAEAESKAKQVSASTEKLIATTKDLMSAQKDDISNSNINLISMMSLLNEFSELKVAAASLPAADGSCHKPVRTAALEAIQAGQTCFECWQAGCSPKKKTNRPFTHCRIVIRVRVNQL